MCNCCYETRPHKCPSFSSPRNSSQQIFYSVLHGAGFAVLLSGIDQGPSFTLGELYPLCMHTYKKKRFSPVTRLPQVNKAPARFAFCKISGLNLFLFFLTWFFSYVRTCFKACHYCEMLGRFVVADCQVSDHSAAHSSHQQVFLPAVHSTEGLPALVRKPHGASTAKA